MIYFPLSFRVASLALGQFYDCPSVTEATLKDMGKIGLYLTTTNHAKVWIFCIILGFYYISVHKANVSLYGKSMNATSEKQKPDSTWLFSLHWRYNDHDGVSNHQPHGCLLNRLFRRRSKKTSKLRITGLCVGNSLGPVNSQHKRPVTRKMFPFDDVIMYFDYHHIHVAECTGKIVYVAFQKYSLKPHTKYLHHTPKVKL